MYGAFAEHVVYYIVEAENINAVNQFLLPGVTRCECEITPVSDAPFVP